jgi:hypothetical protein
LLAACLFSFPFLVLAAAAGEVLSKPIQLATLDAHGHVEFESVAKILAQFPGPAIVHGPKSTGVLLCVVPVLPFAWGIAGVWASAVAVERGSYGGAVLIFLVGGVILLFSLWSVLFAVRIKRKRLPCLTLDLDGFCFQKPLNAIRPTWGIDRLRWSDASGFKPGFDTVAFSDMRPPGRLWEPFVRVRGVLPGLDLGGKPLARLMNQWRERALAASSARSS